MILPYRLLATDLRRNDQWQAYLGYMKVLEKCQANALRLKFLDNCSKAGIIPRFLKFRIPNNGCFDTNSVLEFQKKLLRKEIVKARHDSQKVNVLLEDRRKSLRSSTTDNQLVSIAFHSRTQAPLYIQVFRELGIIDLLILGRNVCLPRS